MRRIICIRETGKSFASFPAFICKIVSSLFGVRNRGRGIGNDNDFRFFAMHAARNNFASIDFPHLNDAKSASNHFYKQEKGTIFIPQGGLCIIFRENMINPSSSQTAKKGRKR
jgi:hypothetical protein